MGRYVVAGPPCSGKTTYVREHAQRGDVIYDYDTLHQALSGRASYQHDPVIRPYVLRARNAVVRLLSENPDQSAWIITSSPKADEVRRLRDELNGEVVVVSVERDEAHRRCDADERPAEWHEYIDNWFDNNDIDAAEFEHADEGRHMKTDTERRYCQGEVRAIEADGKRRIVGYAARTNVLSEDMGGWREMILPGAFGEVLGNDVRGLFNHDPNMILGRTPDTLALAEDNAGLRYEIDPPDTQYARDLLVSLARGDIDQSSFQFRVAEDTWEQPTDDRPYPIRRIVRFAKLYDVSPVTFPAYPTTSAEARSKASELARQATGAEDNDAGAPTARRLDVLRRKLTIVEVQ